MPKRGKHAVHRQKRRQQRAAKRSYSSDSSEGLGEEIKEVFDQMDFIYGELEEWLVGYCGCLVQREQTGVMDNDALENLLDRLLGICHQMQTWIELVDIILKNPSHVYEESTPPPDHEHDCSELRRRLARVREVQTYLDKLKLVVEARHGSHLLTSDHRPYAQLSDADRDHLAYRYARYIQSAFPATTVERLADQLDRVSVEEIPAIMAKLPFTPDAAVPVQAVPVEFHESLAKINKQAQ